MSPPAPSHPVRPNTTPLPRRDFLARLGQWTSLGLIGSQAACDSPNPVTGDFVGTHPERGHLLRQPLADAASVAPHTRQRRTRVLIAGAGVAGLAAARALRLQGMNDFVMLDLENEAGGNSRSTQINGLPCPMGAHYLPVPSDAAHEVQDLLQELGLRRQVAGRWQYDPRHLCHSPQERLFLKGQWQEGLLPLLDVSPGTLAQYQRFAQVVSHLQQQSRWRLPISRGNAGAAHADLRRLTFAAFLTQQGLNDPHLLWYLDYCCRDDYGAGITTVSAWAGLHYFASRHGFKATATSTEPARERHNDESDGVLTWPEGNAWITQRLAAPLGERLHTQQVIRRITEQKHHVEILSTHALTGETWQWQADRVIVALPVMVAARVITQPPPLLQMAARQVRTAPWMVANLFLDAPLFPGAGALPSWDNVIYGGSGLGYVNATHQNLQSVPQATVLTYYKALGDQPQARTELLNTPWQTFKQQVMADLTPTHPDLPYKIRALHVTRYGHAMAIPMPGSLGPWDWHMPGTRLGSSAPPPAGRLHFAHSDWAGYSVFEEAFVMGHGVGVGVGVAAV